MKEFIIKFKAWCLVFFASLSFVMMIVFIRQKLVSQSAFKMDYPELVFANPIEIDSGVVISSVKNAIKPFIDKEHTIEVDIDAMKDALLNLPWVKNVAVVRDLPSVIRIVIESKKIVAYKNLVDEYYPVSSDGEALNMPFDLETLVKINKDNKIIIFGTASEKNINSLLKVLNEFPDLKMKVAGAQYINGLRWNLILYDFKDGLIVKLGEDYEKSLNKLMELDAVSGILLKNIKEVDLRNLDRMLIKKRGV